MTSSWCERAGGRTKVIFFAMLVGGPPQRWFLDFLSKHRLTSGNICATLIQSHFSLFGKSNAFNILFERKALASLNRTMGRGPEDQTKIGIQLSDVRAVNGENEIGENFQLSPVRLWSFRQLLGNNIFLERLIDNDCWNESQMRI